ncbi:uncharacterized protein LOC119578717 [Penaeus monodon]|uniref:uncharacterized protein LOC119578717 n=1 Tax=Penaeus monodon TaxID=6687 RepID=UPI0018A78725|nr:uncharacterized protein LOC119578717 [Penaeus monodon]
MSNVCSAFCAAALLSGWISRFGIPAHITSDRGTSFTSQLWTSLGQLLGTPIYHTTAYNPEANSMVERFHRTLKVALMSQCSNSMWFSQLPWVLLGLRTTPKEGIDVSPAEMVFGDPLVVPGEFFPNAPSSNDIARLRRIVGKFAPCKQTYRSQRSTHDEYSSPGRAAPLTYLGASSLTGEYCNRLVASLLDPTVTSDDRTSGWPLAIRHASITRGVAACDYSLATATGS